MREILELEGKTLDYFAAVIETARENGQTVKIVMDGGVKIKRGQSMWTPPLGYFVDGNGDRIMTKADEESAAIEASNARQDAFYRRTGRRLA